MPEHPKVPLGYSFLAFFNTKKEAIAYAHAWKKIKKFPVMVTYNDEDYLYTVWKLTGKYGERIKGRKPGSK